MNNCDMYQELISRLVDGELSRDEYAALEEHMKGCSECSAMYAVFASLSDIIGGEAEPLPEDLHENIMAGVRRSAMINHNKRRLSKPVRNSLAAAACAALVLFAARGLSPAEKAAQNVLTENEAAVMDVAENAAEEPAARNVEPSPEAAVSPAPAVVPSAAPVVTPRPTASPKPTANVYLGSDVDEARPVNTPNSNAGNNSVVVTPKPTEIVVHTPGDVSTPVPTATADNKVTITASPKPSASEVSAKPESPAEAAPAALDEGAEGIVPAAEDGAASNAESQASGGTSAYVTEAAPEEAAAPAVPAAPEAPKAAESQAPANEQAGVVVTEAPSFSQRFFSLFSFAMPETVSDSSDEAAAEESMIPQSPATSGPAEPEASAEAEALENELQQEESDTEQEILIKLEDPVKLTELEDMLDGDEAELPETEADESYCFVLAEPGEILKDYKLKVYIHGEELYYVQELSEDMFVTYLSACTMEDFEKFMDSLSESERANLAVSPSPVPSAAASADPAAANVKTQSESVHESPAPTAAEQK